MIERKYFVQFMFLADSTTTMKSEALQMELTELAELSALDTERTEVLEVAGEMVIGSFGLSIDLQVFISKRFEH